MASHLFECGHQERRGDEAIVEATIARPNADCMPCGTGCGLSDVGNRAADAKKRSASTKKLCMAVIFCLFFMSLEVAGGIKANSLAVLTDAAHLLTDVAGFAISLFAIWASGWEATPRQTYGFFRLEILGALVSIQLIWLITGILVYEAIDRILHNRSAVDGGIMFIVSTFGLIVNIVMVFLLGHHGHDHGHDHDHSHGDGNWHSQGHEAKHGHGHSHKHKDGKTGTVVCQDSTESTKPLLPDVERAEYSNHEQFSHSHDAHEHSHSDGQGDGDGDIHSHHHGHKVKHGHEQSHKHKDRSELTKSLLPDSERAEHSGHKQFDHSHDAYNSFGNGWKNAENRHSHGDIFTLDHNVQSMKMDKDGHSHSNINVQGAYLHVLGDLIQSIGVMIGGAVIWLKPEWRIIDLICTLFFSVLVLGTTIKMLRSILEVLMESTPREIDATRLEEGLCAISGVLTVHELHIWAITVGKILLACHVRIQSDANADVVLQRVIEYIEREYKISHVTVQIEREF
eukprot:Gb_36650 [translate_table: standard]